MVNQDEMNIADLSNDIAFTKSILVEGDADDNAKLMEGKVISFLITKWLENFYKLNAGEWFEVSIKLMFEKSILKSDFHDADTLLGIKSLRTDSFTKVQLQMGYFTTQITKILHRFV